MPTVKAQYDGEVFIPDEPVRLPIGTEVEVMLDESTNQRRNSPKRRIGGLEGKIWISPDFDSVSPTS